jgi:hypothetical protein
LINSDYDTPEPIYVRLILTGERCHETILAAWQSTLGGIKLRNPAPAGSPKTFDVLSELKSVKDVEKQLLLPLHRNPRIKLMLKPLKADQRRLLDEGKTFSVHYEARSFLKGGHVIVNGGCLTKYLPTAKQPENQREADLDTAGSGLNHPASGEDAEEIHGEVLTDDCPPDGIKLIAIDPNIPSSTEASFDVLPPEDRELEGRPWLGAINLSLHPDAKVEILEFSTYQLQLTAKQPPTIETLPLLLEPCNDAQRRRLILKRAIAIACVAAGTFLLFFLGFLLWRLTGSVPLASPVGLAHVWLETVIVHAHRRWTWILVAFGPSLIFASGSLPSAVLFVVVAVHLGLVLVFLKKLEHLPVVFCVCYAIEHFALPSIIHLILTRLE